MSRVIPPAPNQDCSEIHDAFRTRSGAPVTAPDSTFLDDRAPPVEWCLRAYTLSDSDLLTEVQGKLAQTGFPETQWQGWRLLYAAIRLHPRLKVPASIIQDVVTFLKHPLPEAVDIIASDIDAHVANQNFAISAKAAISSRAVQHNLCAKLEAQLLSILLTLCISGNRDTKIEVARAGGHCLLQDLATSNMDQHHLTASQSWLLHPKTKTRVELLNSLIPFAIYAIEEVDNLGETVLPPVVKLPNAVQNLVRDLNSQLQLLYEAMLPRDQGGIDNLHGISFGDLVTEAMTEERCEALTADLEYVGSSCSPAANYVRTILHNWSLALGKPAAFLAKDALCWLLEEPKGIHSRIETQKRKEAALQKKRSRRACVAALSVVVAIGSLAFRHHALKMQDMRAAIAAAAAASAAAPLPDVEKEGGVDLELDWWHESH